MTKKPELKMIIDDIKIYQKNAKLHPDSQLKSLALIVKEVGWRQPVVANQEGYAVVGNGRLMAWLKYKDEFKLKPIWIIDDKGNTIHGEAEKTPLTEEQERAYRLADNKLNESAWEMDLVIEELKLLSDEMIDLTGFDKDLIIDTSDDDFDLDEEAKKIGAPKIQFGDLYGIDGHKILCGDSQNPEHIKTLMGDKIARLIFSSAPYNMGRAGDMYENYSDDLKSEDYIKLNLDVINNCKKYLRGFLLWNLSYNKNQRGDFLEIFYRITKDCGLRFLELICWNKKHSMPISSRKMLSRQFESILVTADEGTAKEDLELYFCGANDERAYFNKKINKCLTNYWEISPNKIQLKNLKACFPIELVNKAISLTTERGDVVLDPFLGSGTTVVSAIRSGRVGYGCEISPLYVQLTLDRIKKAIGRSPTKIGNIIEHQEQPEGL